MADNQLEVIVKDSGLEPAKATIILNQFKDYFQIAAEWETKAKFLIVTREDQTAEMEMARTGRLFLQKQRVAVENARKSLKEQALREGKAIDGIANVLKALIVPIEEHLEKQEKFIEFREAERLEAKRLEIEKRMIEEERIAQEKLALEQARLKEENERLKAEALKLEAQRKEEQQAAFALAEKERVKAAKKLADERAKAKEAQDKADAERRAIEAKAQKEREVMEEKARKEKERAIAKLEVERKEKQRLEEILKNTIECPHCHKTFQLERK